MSLFKNNFFKSNKFLAQDEYMVPLHFGTHTCTIQAGDTLTYDSTLTRNFGCLLNEDVYGLHISLYVSNYHTTTLSGTAAIYLGPTDLTELASQSFSVLGTSSDTSSFRHYNWTFPTETYNPSNELQCRLMSLRYAGTGATNKLHTTFVWNVYRFMKVNL